MLATEIAAKAERFCKKHKVDRYPVRIVDLCNLEGISVFEQYLPNNVSGFIVIQKENYDVYGTSRLIVVNLADSAKRRRFTIAHELAHYILHRDEGQELYAHRDAGQNGGIEREANIFASCVLMPKELVRNAVNEIDLGFRGGVISSMMIDHIAEEFIVSREAAQIRLEQLGILRG